jgi:preprotein translocase subunit SecG
MINHVVYKKEMIHLYACFAFIVALLLNPQQTKYFGGLATEWKQFGFFVTYKRAENFVYFLSWICMLFFFQASFYLALASPA